MLADDGKMLDGDIRPPLWAADASSLPAWTDAPPPRHVHLLASLDSAPGRFVADLALAWSGIEARVDVVLLEDTEAPGWTPPGIFAHALGGFPPSARTAVVAALVRKSGLPAYCHQLPDDTLDELWRHGCRTVPVAYGGVKDGTPWRWGERVPFVATHSLPAAGDVRSAGLSRPLRLLRPVAATPPSTGEKRRHALRAALGISDSTFLIGMVGDIAPVRRHVKAVRVLAALREMGRDASLVIVGATRPGASARARSAAEAEAARLDVRRHLVFAGMLADPTALLGAYDLFLDTGLPDGGEPPLALLSAVAAGVPSIAVDGADVPGAVLLPADATDTVWAEALNAAVSSAPCGIDGRARWAAAALWPWTLALGPGAALPPSSLDLLFVTGNLDVGGAQRSLCNLAAALATKGKRVAVGVCGSVGVPAFAAPALAAGAEVLSLAGDGGLAGRCGRVLSLARARAPRAVVFWNLDPATKVAVTKAISGGPLKVADVSPGPSLYRELDAKANTATALSLPPDDYLAALDLLVAKYHGGGPATSRSQPQTLAVIPNGVPAPPPPLADGDGPTTPDGADPALAVVTVGRLAAAKRPELLPLVAKALARLVPGATLTVVGGAHTEAQVSDAWQTMLAACDGSMPDNLTFVGPDTRATAFLGRFACFYMVSLNQGCPNASLEAMAAGLPVVANPDGGTAEQVEDGVTGRLVADPGDPVTYAEQLAEALAAVLSDPARRQAMGEAARTRARERFSMAAMADSYAAALLGAHPEEN